MRFRQFLEDFSGSGSGDFEYISMPPEVVTDWIERNCPKYLERAAGDPIFRGAKTPLATVKNSNDFHRRSANTYNFYTLFIDAHPNWKKYPKRARSFICSTSYGTADGFGEVSLVFPADDNLIGICPDSDLWSSFGNHDLSAVNGVIATGIEMLTDVSNPATIDDIGQLRDAFEQLTPSRIEKWLERYRDTARNATVRYMVDLQALLKKYDATDAFDLFMKLLTPEPYFKVLPAAEFRSHTDHEVWVQGKCAFINLYELGAVDGSPEAEVLVTFLRKHGLQKYWEHR